jgi:Asp-tRNA(Asn)/Glu-tRNA(Gln) amidotransferase A subunit family amidase
LDVTDPADLTAIEARQLISRRRLSPVELAEACIARVEAINPAVNALIAYDFGRVREDARAAEAKVMAGEALGPLHGLPVGVKDMTNVAGLTTTFGSEAFRGNVAPKDDAMIAAIREAGGLILGKTNVPEWSAGANTRNTIYGATGNPYDTAKSAAGSSGGSAAALACGMCPVATGTDLGGSLRNPAAFCGVVGFRPSPGLVADELRGQALLPLGTGGPMARTVADAALLLSAQIRPDLRDPLTPVVAGRTHAEPEDFRRLPRVDLSRLRIAFSEDFGFAPTERVIRDSFRAKIAAMEGLFGRLEDAHPNCADADRIFAVLRSLAFLGYHHGLMLKHPDKVGPNVRANIEEGLGYSALDVAEAIVLQGQYYRSWVRFFEGADYLLTPAVTITPRDWHELYPTQIDGAPMPSYYHWLGLAYASTLAGFPSSSMPVGFDKAGMPFGLQVIGRRGDDLGVLAVAAELEAAFAGSTELGATRPDIGKLANARPLREAEGFFSL